jgi:hypothetical protein
MSKSAYDENRPFILGFLVKSLSLATIALTFRSGGFKDALQILFVSSASIDLGFAVGRRQRILAPVLTYWDDAAACLLIALSAAIAS